MHMHEKVTLNVTLALLAYRNYILIHSNLYYKQKPFVYTTVLRYLCTLHINFIVTDNILSYSVNIQFQSCFDDISQKHPLTFTNNKNKVLNYSQYPIP